MPEVTVKPLSHNKIIAFFQRAYRRWLGCWYNFSDAHVKLAPLLYKLFFFLVFSTSVTIWQYIVMTFLPYAFTPLNGGEWGWPCIPVPSAGGVPYVILGDANGLGYFIAFELAVFTAQCINFPLQRNVTFKSHGNPYFQAMWYFIGWAAISVVTSALWGIVNCYFTYWQVHDALSGLVKTVFTGVIAMVIFFFIFMIIFPDRRKQATSARRRYERLNKKGADADKLAALKARAEEAERLAELEEARLACLHALREADARAIAWDEAGKRLKKMQTNGADEAAVSRQSAILSERHAAALKAAKECEEKRALYELLKKE